MTWFKVDDKLHSHSKVRKVLADDPAALALWVVAGSWSSDNLTDGFVPDHQLPWLIPSGADELAQKLVAARLWKRVRGGHLFHEWEADGDGTKRNPTRVEVEEERRKKAEAGRKGGLASGRTRSRPEAPASAPATPAAEAPADGLVEPPTRPDPTMKNKNSSPPPAVAPDAFDDFWTAYPRKVGKGQARKAWTKAVKTTAPEVILAGAQRYARERQGQDQQYTAHPATWLNGERWTDQPALTPAASGGADWWDN